jgi:hypothetical protein
VIARVAIAVLVAAIVLSLIALITLVGSATTTNSKMKHPSLRAWSMDTRGMPLPEIGTILERHHHRWRVVSQIDETTVLVIPADHDWGD